MKQLRGYFIAGFVMLMLGTGGDVEASYVKDYPEEAKKVHELMSNGVTEGYISPKAELGLDNMYPLLYEVINSYYDTIYVKDFRYWGTSGRLEIDYYKTPEELESIKSNLSQDVDKLLGEIIPKGADDFTKVLKIHDWVVQNVEYDKVYLQDKSLADQSVHNADGAFYNRSAICGGYARLMSIMLDKVGVENNYVLGYIKSNGGYHAWNQVKVDGQWYYVDATFDDPSTKEYGDIRYNYFLMSQETAEKTYTWESEYFPKTGNKYDWMQDMTNFNGNPLQIKDGYVYYSSKSGGEALHRIRLDGTKKERLTQGRVPYFVIAGDKAYISNYTNRGYLYSINLKGSKNATILNRSHVKNIRLIGDKIYYDNETVKKKVSYKVL